MDEQLFSTAIELAPQINVDDNFLNEAASGEYCFVEDLDVKPYEKFGFPCQLEDDPIMKLVRFEDTSKPLQKNDGCFMWR